MRTNSSGHLSRPGLGLLGTGLSRLAPPDEAGAGSDAGSRARVEWVRILGWYWEGVGARNKNGSMWDLEPYANGCC
jgi:hypothetical protein